MIKLDKKLLDLFKGYVVRKDVVRNVKGGANVPVFVIRGDNFIGAVNCDEFIFFDIFKDGRFINILVH